MDLSSKSKRAETRAFWEEAVRLWGESGLSVREFCSREGLAEHAFYARRRELQPEDTVPEIEQGSSPVTSNGEAIAAVRRRRRRKQIAADNAIGAPITPQFVELVAPASANLCHCTIELDKPDGAKMRIQLRSAAMPDLAAISQSFWNHC